MIALAGTGDLTTASVAVKRGKANTVEFFGDLGGATGRIELEAVAGSDDWDRLVDDTGTEVSLVAGQGVSFASQAANWRAVLPSATAADAKVVYGAERV